MTKASSDLAKRVKNGIKQLKLDLLYNKHKDIVIDIIRATQIYTKKYIADLQLLFPNIIFSEEEILQMLYMNYATKEKWGERILAKLTYDIRKEFEIN